MADRRIRTILEAQVDSFQKGLRDGAKAARDVAQELDALEKRAKALDSLHAKVQVDADADKAEQSIEGVKDSLAQVDGETATADVKVDADKAEAQVEQVGDALTKIDGETANADVKVEAGKAEAAIDGARKKLDSVDGEKATMKVDVDASALDDLGEGAGKAGAAAGGEMTAGLMASLRGGPWLAAGALAGGVFVAGIKKGIDAAAGRALLQAKTGLDEATAAKLGRAASQAYSQAWGDSIGTNMETARVALANSLIRPEDTEQSIAAVVSQLTAITDIIGGDIPEVSEAAGAMIKNKLAKNAEEAFDTIITGYQRGADRSGDFVDTLREYSGMFKSLGLDGPKAVGLISQAMAAGARTSDLAADALKEFSIRGQDGSKAVAAGFQLLGLDAKKMTKAIAEGGPAAEDALGKTLNALRQIEDPVKRNAAGVALFGTQWEDLGNGAGILAMNLGTLGEAFGDSAGAAQQAMDTISSTTASKLETAKRQVEVAAQGIALALGAAFADDATGIAEWVAENRAAILQFALQAGQSFFGLAEAAVQFSAGTVRALGLAAAALGPFISGLGAATIALGVATGNDGLVKIGTQAREVGGDMEQFGAKADAAADLFETSTLEALDKTEERFKNAIGPEILTARISDAVTSSKRRLGELATAIDATEGTVTINGDAMPAEGVLDSIVGNIDASDGTVTINGNRVPAGEALDTIIGLVNAGKGDITIGADAWKARQEADAAQRYANSKTATIDINANAGDVSRAIALMQSRINANPLYVPVRSSVQIPRADGGWINPGRAAGGWVPGAYPGKGVDNLLWPLAKGGRTLSQPLAGKEFVVNAVSAAQWGPALEAINGGMSPSGLAGDSGPSASSIRAALDGATLRLGSVDPITRHLEATLVTSLRRH